MQELNFRHYPDNVNLIQLAAAIVVTATNNISSSSVCIGINFDSALPENNMSMCLSQCVCVCV